MERTALRLSRKTLFDILIVVAFALINFVIASRHEPWRDEAQTWLLARDSPLAELLFEHVRYQRHPFLWYLLIVPLAKSGLPYFSQALLHLAFAVAASALFLIKAPLPRLSRILFVFSYFMMYEYAIVAREYVVAIFLLFLIAWLYPRRMERPWAYGALLFLLFNSTYLCFLTAFSLFLLFAMDARGQKPCPSKVRWALGVMLLGCILALLQGGLLPQDHADRILPMPPNYGAPIYVISKAFFPLTFDISRNLAMAISIVTLGLAVASLIKKPIPLLILVFSYAGLFYIFIYKHPGFLRHYGFVLIFLLFAFWLGSYYEDRDWLASALIERLVSVPAIRSKAWLALNLCMVLSVKYTFDAHVAEFFMRFSGAKEMAASISSLEDRYPRKDYVIVAHPSAKAAALLPYLPERQFWYADIENFGTFTRFVKKQQEGEGLSNLEVVTRARQFFPVLSQVLILVQRPLEFNQAFGYRFHLLQSVDTQLFGYGDERFYLYKPVYETSPKAPSVSGLEGTTALL